MLAAVGAASYLYACGSDTRLGDLFASDVGGGVLTYSSLAFGFCLAGLTVALTVPSESFVRFIASDKVAPNAAALKDLFFVFTWTAFVHWLAIIYAIWLLISGETQLFPQGAATATRLAAAAGTGLMVYAVGQFVVVILTLSQLAATYVRHVVDTPDGPQT